MKQYHVEHLPEYKEMLEHFVEMHGRLPNAEDKRALLPEVMLMALVRLSARIERIEAILQEEHHDPGGMERTQGRRLYPRG